MNELYLLAQLFWSGYCAHMLLSLLFNNLREIILGKTRNDTISELTHFDN